MAAASGRDGTAVDRAVVVGASVAGLAGACALARTAREVVVLERHQLPEDGQAATIAPQGAFPHVLLAGGAAALERLAPGLSAWLFARGAVRAAGDFSGHWWAEGAVRRTFPDLGIDVPMCSRALVETGLRTHVRSLPNVDLVGDAVMERVLTGDGRVRGVEARVDGEPRRIEADLVVDASGRASRAARWLADERTPEPAMTRVEVDLTYTAVEVRRHPDDLAGGLFAMVQNSRELARLGVALPAEGERWNVVLAGYFGDAAAASREDVLAFAASLPDPTIRRLLDNEWVSEPRRFHFAASQRRHWEKTAGLPPGFCVIGDAVASFNPLYGQGMSAAALQVEALAGCLAQHGNDDLLPRRVARAAAKVVDTPWRIATGADFIYPRTAGRKPPGTDRVNRYLSRVMIAAAHDRMVHLALMRVQHLLAPPTSLFAPAVVRRTMQRTGPVQAAVA